jgi:hypothetical protein
MAVMMVVVEMLVMVMTGVAMVVRRMIVRGVGVRIALGRVRMAAGIGAAFGIERRLDLDDACA